VFYRNFRKVMRRAIRTAMKHIFALTTLLLLTLKASLAAFSMSEKESIRVNSKEKLWEKLWEKPWVKTASQNEAAEIIKNVRTKQMSNPININSDKLAVKKLGQNQQNTNQSSAQEVEDLLENVEVMKHSSKAVQDINVSEVLENVKKVQISKSYKTQEDWIKTHKNELFAKQSQPLPTIDYNITAKDEKENSQEDAITKLLSNYRLKTNSQPGQTDKNTNPLLAYPLFVFVSATIPKISLKQLMIQTRKANGVLVFRGLIGGSLRNTQQFLGEIAKENVSAIIDPRLFTSFKIELVPSFVVINKSADLAQNCQEISCDFTPIHDRITGNITLDYALEQISQDGSNKTALGILDKLKQE